VRLLVGTIDEKPGDLSRRVDVIGVGIKAAWEIDCRVSAVAIKKAVRLVGTIGEIPGDLSRGVNV
jgi:hypothetical protein